MSVITKVGGIVATTGAVGGALALGTYSLINNQNIQKRLEEEGYEILDFSKTDQSLTAVLEAYKKEKVNTFTGKQDETQNKDGLKAKCEVALNSKTDDLKNYLLARQWCVKERTVTDILKKQNFKILKVDPTDSNTNEDDKHWVDKEKEYATSNSKNKIKVENQDTKPITKDQIIKACKELNTPELKTTSEEFNDKLEQVKEWCAVKKNSNA